MRDVAAAIQQALEEQKARDTAARFGEQIDLFAVSGYAIRGEDRAQWCPEGWLLTSRQADGTIHAALVDHDFFPPVSLRRNP